MSNFECTAEEIKNFIHSLASKSGGRKMDKRNLNKEVLFYLNKASELNLLNDRKKFYLCRNNNFLNNDLNDKYFFLEYFINTNNKFKGIYTKEFVESIINFNKKEHFVEFLKILVFTYKKNNFDKELKKIYYQYIKEFNFLISDEKDIKWLSNRNNQLKLYNLLSKGGLVYEKTNQVLCIYSLFYNLTSKKIEKRESNNIIKEDAGNEYFYEEIPLTKSFILNLIKYGYINKKHLTIQIPIKLKRDFYIPKKRRKKRIYTEDQEYIYLDITQVPTDDILVQCIEYEINTPKLTKTFNENGRKIFIEKEQEINTKILITNNQLKDRTFLEKCISLINGRE